MIEQEKDGLTRFIISLLADTHSMAVAKFISDNNILEMEKEGVARYNINDSRRIISGLLNINTKSINKKSFAFYNFKGGTGKTSLCYQVSSILAIMGFNVLVIDADPQAHISTAHGFSNDFGVFTLYDLLINKLPFSQVKKTIFEGLDLIPSNLSLTRLETELNYLTKREEILLNTFIDIRNNYDFIFVDTNPTISLLNRNVITFADVVSVICETQPFSLNGLKILIEDLRKFYASMNINDRNLLIIPNKYEDRTSSSAEAMTALKNFYGDFIIKDFAIRKSEDINIAAKLGKPLPFFAKKNSIALADIVDLVFLILNIYTE